jgi:hypothetical protein
VPPPSRRPRSVPPPRTSLGDAKSSLGGAKSSLGDAKSSLGDAKSSLGDAKSSLGDAESSLGDASASPSPPVVLVASRGSHRLATGRHRWFVATDTEESRRHFKTIWAQKNPVWLGEGSFQKAGGNVQAQREVRGVRAVPSGCSVSQGSASFCVVPAGARPVPVSDRRCWPA